MHIYFPATKSKQQRPKVKNRPKEKPWLISKSSNLNAHAHFQKRGYPHKLRWPHAHTWPVEAQKEEELHDGNKKYRRSIRCRRIHCPCLHVWLGNKQTKKNKTKKNSSFVCFSVSEPWTWRFFGGTEQKVSESSPGKAGNEASWWGCRAGCLLVLVILRRA